MRSPNTTTNHIKIHKHQYTTLSKQARTKNTGLFNLKNFENVAIGKK